jgi:hypothetical protein
LEVRCPRPVWGLWGKETRFLGSCRLAVLVIAAEPVQTAGRADVFPVPRGVHKLSNRGGTVWFAGKIAFDECVWVSKRFARFELAICRRNAGFESFGLRVEVWVGAVGR